MGDNSYGDEIWCYMAFCAQVEEIGVGGGCDSILVRKITELAQMQTFFRLKITP